MSRPKTKLRRCTAGVALSALFMAGLSAPPASAAPEDETSQAEAAMLTGDGIIDLDAILKSQPQFASVPSTPGTANKDMNLTLLSGIELPAQSGIDIAAGTKLSDLLTIGVGGQSATANPGETAQAAAGVLNGQGLISVGGTEAAEPSKLTLNPLLKAAGLDSLVNDLTLELKAVSGQAVAEKGKSPEGKYDLVGTKLTIESKAVKELNTGLTKLTGTLGDTLNKALGEGEGLDKVLGGVNSLVTALGQVPVLNNVIKLTLGDTPPGVSVDTDLSGVLAPLLEQPLTSASGAVAISLKDGTITVDLNKLMDDPDAGLAGLNEMDPNTELLSGPVLNEIIAQVTELVGGEEGLTGKVNDIVKTLVGTTKLKVNVGLDVRLLPVLGTPGLKVASATVNINASLGQILGWDKTPLQVGEGKDVHVGATLLSNLLPIKLDALTDALVGGLVKQIVPTIGKAIEPIVDGLLDELVPELVQPIVQTLLSDDKGIGKIFTLLSDNLLALTVNRQEYSADVIAPGSPKGPGKFINPLGDDTRAFTERALYVSLLPKVHNNEGLLSLGLGNATVVGEKVEASIAVNPNSGKAGDEVAVTGAGFKPNSTVTVTIGGKDAGTVGTDDAGNIKPNSKVTVPNGIDSGSAKVVGTDEDGTKAEADFTIESAAGADDNASASSDPNGDDKADQDGNQDSSEDASASSDPSGDDQGAGKDTDKDGDQDSKAAANANASASAGASVNADSESNAAAQAAAVAAATADSDSAASAASDKDATAAAESAAEADASKAASTDASSDKDAASAAAAQAAANSEGDDDGSAESSAAKDANASAAASSSASSTTEGAAESEGSTDASQDAASDASAASDPNGDDKGDQDGDQDSKSSANANASSDPNGDDKADQDASKDASAASDPSGDDKGDQDSKAAANANASASAGASVNADSESNAAAQAAAVAAATADSDSAASAASDKDATAAAESAAETDASKAASTDASSDKNAEASAAAQAAASSNSDDDATAAASAAKDADASAVASASSTTEGAAESEGSKDASSEAAADANGSDQGSKDASGDADGVTATPKATVKYTKIDRREGVTQVVTGTGFKAGESVKATVHSKPVELGSAKADKAGKVTFEFKVGSDFELGKHHVAVTGEQSGEVSGDARTTDFTVFDGSDGSNGSNAANGSGDEGGQASAGSSGSGSSAVGASGTSNGSGTSSGSTSGHGSQGGLASTGVQVGVGIAGLVALLLIVAGAVMTIQRRRRNS